MDNLERDLKKTALIFSKELLNLKQGEKLLLYVDQGSCFTTAKAIQDSAQEIGIETELFEINSSQKYLDMPQELTDKIEKGAFDVICELSEQYFDQSPAWQKALQSGSRIFSLGEVNADAFIRCVGNVNHKSMFQFGMALRKTLKKAKSIQIVTKEGTKIKFQMDTNLVSRFIPGLETNIIFRLFSRLQRKLFPKLTRTQRSRIAVPHGMQIQRGQTALLGGQIGFRGIPETIEGTAVIDGYLWPPREIGHIDTPVIYNIKKGHVVEFSGCPIKSKLLNNWFKGEEREIIHFCIGFNPQAKLSGQLTEAERVFGYVTIGIGNYPFHVDGIIKSPSVILDDEMIEQDGSFIHKKLSRLEKILTRDYEN